MIHTLLAALIFLLSTSACDMQELEFDDEQADFSDPLWRLEAYQNQPLVFQIPHRFDFCPESTAVAELEEVPAVDSFVDLGNAHWLAFLSANQYAHFARLAPMLEELGFGNPGEGTWWEDQARDLVIIAEQEAQGLVVAGSSARFKQQLLQTVRPGSKMQFFSGGSVVDNEFVTDSTQVAWIRHSTLPLVLIIFRGTEPDGGEGYSDILLNVKAAGAEIPSWGHVHSGFLEGWWEVHELILEKTLSDGIGAHVWLSGHSLGGALATIATTALSDINSVGKPKFSIDGLYTFGQPRVGNERFATSLTRRSLGYSSGADRIHGTSDDLHDDPAFSVIRFRNADDFITQVPPATFGYRHTGNVLHLPANSTRIDTHIGIELGSTDSEDGSFDDHSMRRYYPRLVEAIRVGSQDSVLACR